MLDELEALIGHVYVVGGRAVTTTPPGAIVELPPRKPQRGREQDTFFALVTPAGNVTGQASFYEQLARLAADLYFRTSGGVTSGLREAIGVVNNNLIEHNVVAGQRYEANMICMVLRGHEVYVARAGSCLCLLRQGELFTTLPDDLRDEYTVNGLPLGYSPVADIKLSHYEVAPGHVMVLSDAGFAQSERSDLRSALAAGSIQHVIEPLKTLGGGKVQAIIVEFVSTDTPDPIAPTSATTLKIMRSSAAPSAVPAAPLSATGEAIIAPAPEAHPSPIIEDESPIVPRTKSQPVNTSARSQSAIKSANVPINPVSKSVSTPIAPRSAVSAEAIPPVHELAAETGRKAVGGAASVLSILTGGLARLFVRLLPEPEEGGPQVPAMLAAGLAILVPVIIVFIVVAVRLTQVDMTEFEAMVQDVETAANQAKLIPITNVNASREAWLGVIQRIEDAELTSGRPHETFRRIRAEAQAILDNYDRVTRREVTHLRSFSEDSILRGPILQGNTSIYTLDIKNNAIYRDTLNDITNTIAIRGNQPIVQKGQAVGAHAVRQLVDIIWIAEGGIPRANSLAALDTQGILITYSPTFAPANSQTLPGSDLWVKPIALATWRARLYILDVGSNQIWRYRESGPAYPDPPEEYFSGDARRDLKNAVDFGINANGHIFILFANGTMKRYEAGIEQPFSFSNLPVPDGKLQSANSMYLDNDSTLPAIYITDPVDMSIYQVTQSGAFRARFRATEDHAFDQLTGVYVNQEQVYVASGSRVYTFTMNDTALTPTP